MRQIFESVLELRGIQEKFHSQSELEVKRRKDLEKYVEINGTCNEIEYNDAESKENFSLEISRYEENIKEISNTYKVSYSLYSLV